MSEQKIAKVTMVNVPSGYPATCLSSNSPHSTVHAPPSTSQIPRPTSHVSRPTSHVLLLMLILSSGCISPPRNATLIDVPFIPQEQTNQCGVVSLAMAMDFHQVPYNFDVLTDNAYIPTLGGTPINLLALVAEAYGLHAKSIASDISDLHSAIAAHDVPIIYLPPNDDSQIGHFVVVTGVSLDNKKLRIHDLHRKDRWVRSSALMKRKSKGRFPSVIISKTPTP